MYQQRKLLIPFFVLCCLLSISNYAQILFSKHSIDETKDGPCSIFAADINADSLTDFVAASWNSNDLTWWKNEGGNPVSWKEYNINSFYRGASFVVADDIDGDNDLDIVSSAWDDNAIAWWRNDGGEPVQWKKNLITSDFLQAHEVYTVDIDNDSDIDILGASAGQHEIALWKNEGGDPVIWTKQTIDNNFFGARSVFAAHIDADSLVDVVGAGLINNDITWWKNNGGDPIQWTEHTIDAGFQGAHKVYCCDLDDDGDMDVLGAAYVADEIAVWYNDLNNQGGWIKQVIGSGVDGALIVSAADIDGDNKTDVLGTSDISNEVAVWFNNGETPVQWNKFTLDNSFTGAWPVSAADINNDGKTDILAGAFHGDKIAWWENQMLTTNVGENFSNLPESFCLLQNFPNPFNPATTINYEVPLNSDVEVRIYNLMGMEIKTLVDEVKSAGRYSVQWDGTDKLNRRVVSGVYFCRLIAGKYSISNKMILMK